MMRTTSACLAWLVLLAPGFPAAVSAAGGSFVLRAARIMPVSPKFPWVIEDGTIVVRDGRIAALGADVRVPPDLPIVEYPRGTIVPGLVAAASDLGGAHRGDESVAAGYRAADAFDRFGNYARTLAEGVTTVHLSPGTHRLLTGQGAVVKLGGDPEQRMLRTSADLTINLGIGRPPLDVTYSFPASADVPIPLPRRQRPASRMGQFLALEEALRQTQTKTTGPFSIHRAALARAWKDRLPLRVHADRAVDLLGTIRFLSERKRRGYVVGGAEVDRVAAAMRDAHLPLVLLTQDRFLSAGGDAGNNPSALVVDRHDFAALRGVNLAIGPPRGTELGNLRLAAVRAARQGLDPQKALEAITRVPAEILGVGNRVGSLEPGKDADFLVLTGSPLDVSTHVRRVYVKGDSVFEPPVSGALVVKAGTVWAKPGLRIERGEVLVEGGKIVAVGSSVPHPPFARVIDVPDGFVTPGLIDGHGHLGLAGDRTAVDNSLRLSRLFGAADVTDLRVCRSGITTAMVAPYAMSPLGSPMAAIKTAGANRMDRRLSDPVAVLFDVSRTDPLSVAETLGKPLAAGQKYLDAWIKYEKDLKAFLEKKKKGEATKPAEKEAEKETQETTGPDPVTGTWEATVRGTPIGDAVSMTIEMQLLNSIVQGRITRSSVGFTGTISGTLAGKHLSLVAEVNVPDAPGPVNIEADLVAEDTFRGTAQVAELAFPIEGRRIDKSPVEIKVTRHRLRGKDGRPLPPPVQPAMEPLKILLEKKIPAVVKVSSAAQIQPVLDLLVDKHKLSVTLLNAEGAHVHGSRLAKHKVAVILPPAIIRIRQNVEYLQADDLARQGVPIVFQSNAEDGARYLPNAVLYATERGLDAEKALAALTIDAARAFKIDNRVGSIEPGKDADLVIFNGHPFRDAGQVVSVVVNGKEVRP